MYITVCRWWALLNPECALISTNNQRNGTIVPSGTYSNCTWVDNWKLQCTNIMVTSPQALIFMNMFLWFQNNYWRFRASQLLRLFPPISSFIVYVQWRPYKLHYAMRIHWTPGVGEGRVAARRRESNPPSCRYGYDSLFYSTQSQKVLIRLNSWLTMASQELIQISCPLKMDFWNLIPIDSRLKMLQEDFDSNQITSQKISRILIRIDSWLKTIWNIDSNQVMTQWFE